jgi:hypothetical protein
MLPNEIPQDDGSGKVLDHFPHDGGDVFAATEVAKNQVAEGNPVGFIHRRFAAGLQTTSAVNQCFFVPGEETSAVRTSPLPGRLDILVALRAGDGVTGHYRLRQVSLR